MYELFTMRPPYDELPYKDPTILHKAVYDGRRPRLTDRVILKMCVIFPCIKASSKNKVRVSNKGQRSYLGVGRV